MSLMNKIVYYDEDYTCCWIDHKKASEVANFLKNKGFVVLNADELRSWMQKVIREEVENTVAVFSLDIAPDTILDDASSNALIKQYLDTGGRIVWIGDVPFFYRGRKGARSIDELEKEDRDFWRTGAPATILGVNPVFAAPLETVRTTDLGSRIGLHTTWAGLRPIAIDKERIWKRLFLKPVPKDRRIKMLAESRCLIAYPWIRSARKWRISISRVEISVSPKIEVAPKEIPLQPYTYWETYVNAWFKNFNEKAPLSGFIRIWDFSPRIVTNNMLKDLYNVATYGLSKI